MTGHSFHPCNHTHTHTHTLSLSITYYLLPTTNLLLRTAHPSSTSSSTCGRWWAARELPFINSLCVLYCILPVHIRAISPVPAQPAAFPAKETRCPEAIFIRMRPDLICCRHFHRPLATVWPSDLLRFLHNKCVSGAPSLSPPIMWLLQEPAA
jgi:hypothetical protein